MIHTGEWPPSPTAGAVIHQIAVRAAAQGLRWAGIEDLAAVLKADTGGRGVVHEGATDTFRPNKRLEKVIELAADG